MSQAIDNLLKGCNNKFSKGLLFTIGICEKNDLCPSCKAKAQGMIEILEDELEFLNDKIFNDKPLETIIEGVIQKNAEYKIQEIQADLNKLKEILK